MIAAFNVNSAVAEHVSAAAPEPNIAPLCQCPRALLGWAVTDSYVAVRGWRGNGAVEGFRGLRVKGTVIGAERSLSGDSVGGLWRLLWLLVRIRTSPRVERTLLSRRR